MKSILYVLLLFTVTNSSSSSSSDKVKCPCWKSKDILKGCKKELGLSGSPSVDAPNTNQCYLSLNDNWVFQSDFFEDSALGGSTFHCGMNWYQVYIDSSFDGEGEQFDSFRCTRNEVKKKGETCKKTETELTIEEYFACFFEAIYAFNDDEMIGCGFSECFFPYQECGGECRGFCHSDASSRSLSCVQHLEPGEDCAITDADGSNLCFTDDHCDGGDICWPMGWFPCNDEPALFAEIFEGYCLPLCPVSFPSLTLSEAINSPRNIEHAERARKQFKHGSNSNANRLRTLGDIRTGSKPIIHRIKNGINTSGTNDHEVIKINLGQNPTILVIVFVIFFVLSVCYFTDFNKYCICNNKTTTTL